MQRFELNFDLVVVDKPSVKSDSVTTKGMHQMDGDNQSVCSSRPSGSNPGVKKRSFPSFSIRRLFYASPLMGKKLLQ